MRSSSFFVNWFCVVFLNISNILFSLFFFHFSSMNLVRKQRNHLSWFFHLFFFSIFVSFYSHPSLPSFSFFSHLVLFPFSTRSHCKHRIYNFTYIIRVVQVVFQHFVCICVFCFSNVHFHFNKSVSFFNILVCRWVELIQISINLVGISLMSSYSSSLSPSSFCLFIISLSIVYILHCFHILSFHIQLFAL